MKAKKNRPRRPRRPNHAKLYEAIKLPKTWIAVLNEYPDPLKVLPILMATRSISVAEEMIDSMDALADALLDAIGDEGMGETEELVRIQ